VMLSTFNARLTECGSEHDTSTPSAAVFSHL